MIKGHGFDWGQGRKIFPFTIQSTMVLGLTQPLLQWIPGALPPGVRRPGREAEYSLPPTAKVTNIWNITLSSSCIFMLWFSSEEKGWGYKAKSVKLAMRLCKNSGDRVPRFVCLVPKLMYVINFKFRLLRLRPCELDTNLDGMNTKVYRKISSCSSSLNLIQPEAVALPRHPDSLSHLRRKHYFSVKLCPRFFLRSPVVALKPYKIKQWRMN